MLADLTIKEFLEQVGSREPVPGGGSVAALSAAPALMVAGLTAGRKGNPELDAKMASLMESASELKAALTNDIDRDSAAYTLVLKAYRMPKGSEEENRARGGAIQKALLEAALVPLSVAEAGLVLLSLAETAVREGNPNAVADGLAAALMARSAALAAVYNVRTNLASLRDEALKARMELKVDALEGQAVDHEARILSLARNIMERRA